MLAGAGTAESVLVVMAMLILSHDQTELKQQAAPRIALAGNHWPGR
jgi:hypothetical protein